MAVDGDVLDFTEHEVRQRAMSDHADVMLERFLQSVLSIEFVVEGFVAGLGATRDGFIAELQRIRRRDVRDSRHPLVAPACPVRTGDQTFVGLTLSARARAGN